MRHSRLLAAVSVGVLALSACGADDTTDTGADGATPTVAAGDPPAPSAAPSTPGATSPAPAAPGAAVPEILQFGATLVGGGSFDGAAYAGKPVAFWFWAPG